MRCAMNIENTPLRREADFGLEMDKHLVVPTLFSLVDEVIRSERLW